MRQFIKCTECGMPVLAKVTGKGFHKSWNFNCYCGSYGFIDESEVEPLKALSIRQPLAWLIVNGYKDIENRNTLKNFRGEFLIHAGQKSDFYVFDELIDNGIIASNVLHDYLGSESCRKGGIIGYATITDCVTETDNPWFVGKYGLVIRDPKPLPFTPCKGKLSFFYPEID